MSEFERAFGALRSVLHAPVLDSTALLQSSQKLHDLHAHRYMEQCLPYIQREAPEFYLPVEGVARLEQAHHLLPMANLGFKASKKHRDFPFVWPKALSLARVEWLNYSGAWPHNPNIDNDLLVAAPHLHQLRCAMLFSLPMRDVASAIEHLPEACALEALCVSALEEDSSDATSVMRLLQSSAMTRCTHLRVRVQYSMEQGAVAQWFSRWPLAHITHLSVCGGGPFRQPLNADAIWAMSRACPNLRHLELRDVGLDQSVLDAFSDGAMPNLSVLCFSGNRGRYDFRQFRRKAGLKHLQLDLYSVSEDELRELLMSETCATLEALDLIKTHGDPTEAQRETLYLSDELFQFLTQNPNTPHLQLVHLVGGQGFRLWLMHERLIGLLSEPYRIKAYEYYAHYHAAWSRIHPGGAVQAPGWGEIGYLPNVMGWTYWLLDHRFDWSRGRILSDPLDDEAMLKMKLEKVIDEARRWSQNWLRFL